MDKITIQMDIAQAERIRDTFRGLAPARSLGQTDYDIYELFRDAIAKSQQQPQQTT